MNVFSPDETPNKGTVHQTLSVYEREHEVKSFENKSVCAHASESVCVLARSSTVETSSSLALLRTDRRLAHSRASSLL